MLGSAIDLALRVVVDRRTADQHERDVADWHCCDDVLRRLAEHGPARDVPMPTADVAGLLRLGAAEGESSLRGDQAMAVSFGEYRAKLTEYEANEGHKLYRLAFAVQTLLRIRTRSARPELIDQALSALGDWVARAWRTDVPVSGDARSWSARMTRRYDLLPRHWREI